MSLIKSSLRAALLSACMFIPVASFAEDVKRVMVFGDSNSWGWMPVATIVPTSRYPMDVRWTGIAAADLGDGFEIINESLSARTAATTDSSLGLEGAGLNGLEYLPAAIASNMPLDLVVIMLGTNDTKAYLNKSPLDISLDIMRLAAEVQDNAGVATTYPPAKVLIVSPPPLGAIADVEWLRAAFSEASVDKSKALAAVLGPLAGAVSIPFLDAGTVATIDGIDGVHMSAESHAALGKAVAQQVRDILQ